MEQRKEPRNRPVIYNHLIFDKGTNAVQWGKGKSLQQMVLEHLYREKQT